MAFTVSSFKEDYRIKKHPCWPVTHERHTKRNILLSAERKPNLLRLNFTKRVTPAKALMRLKINRDEGTHEDE